MDERMKRWKRRGSALALRCASKHDPNSIFCCLHTNSLASIQSRINKCIFYSASAFNMPILRGINTNREKSIFWPLHLQLSAISVVLVFTGKKQQGAVCVSVPVYQLHSNSYPDPLDFLMHSIIARKSGFPSSGQTMSSETPPWGRNISSESRRNLNNLELRSQYGCSVYQD